MEPDEGRGSMAILFDRHLLHPVHVPSLRTTALLAWALHLCQTRGVIATRASQTAPRGRSAANHVLPPMSAQRRHGFALRTRVATAWVRFCSLPDTPSGGTTIGG